MNKIQNFFNQTLVYMITFILINILILTPIAIAESFSSTGTMWSPCLEWNLENNTYSDNPFDLIATVTFTHQGSGKTHITEMFYKGEDTWAFRFTGTKIGVWNFETQSSDPDLDGHDGTITIYPNQDPLIMGFLGSEGNKFTIEIDENNKKSHLYNIYTTNVDELQNFEDKLYLIDSYIDNAEENGFYTLFLFLGNNWFKLGALANNEHNSENPDLESFAILDEFVTQAHQRGMRLHFWAWGDASRRQTPYGGINGIPDRRLQRYIAARLGPLPGWAIGYGFDLEEWVSENQIGSWAEYMHDHMGWPHYLMGRSRDHPELDAVAHPNLGPRTYTKVVNDLFSDQSRPHIYTERDLYLRSMNMNETRTQLWTYVFAGGMGGFWGIYWEGERPYPNPEQLRTFRDFWKDRFLLDFQRDNNITNGYGLKDDTNTHYVFYKTSTTSISMNLSAMTGDQRVIAVDTKLPYDEIDLGMYTPGNYTWNATYSSDWAIAVGDFTPPNDPSLPVELVSFVARARNSEVVLEWKTASEINNSGFIIYRSMMEEGPYNELSSYLYNNKLKGNGNSNVTNFYSYKDRDVKNGIAYWYKLVDVDYNGIKNEHTVIQCTPDSDFEPRFSTFELFQNYPNPFNHITNIEFTVPENLNNNRIILEIYNIQGEKIKTLVDEPLEAGYHFTTWDATDNRGQIVSSNVYLIYLKSDNFYVTRTSFFVK